MSDNVIVTTSTTGEHVTGRVKWFNNKAGYGFITVTDGAQSGMDMFVHHSAIAVGNQQYKYLVQGEYVELNVVCTTGGTHEYQANNVSGIKGGKLMCETRNEFKTARNNYKNNDSEDKQMSTPSENMPKQRAPRLRGEGPRDSEKKEWTVVTKSQPETKPTSSVRGRGRPPRASPTV